MHIELDYSYFTIDDVKNYMKTCESAIKSFCDNDLSKSIVISEIVIAFILDICYKRNNDFIFDSSNENDRFYHSAIKDTYLIEQLKLFLSSGEDEYFIEKDVKEHYVKLIVDNNYISYLEKLRLYNINQFLLKKILSNIRNNLYYLMNKEHIYSLLDKLYDKALFKYKEEIMDCLYDIIERDKGKDFINNIVMSFFIEVLRKFFDNNIDMAIPIIERIESEEISVYDLQDYINYEVNSVDDNIDGKVIRNIVFSQGDSMILYLISRDEDEDITSLEVGKYVEERIKKAGVRM